MHEADGWVAEGQGQLLHQVRGSGDIGVAENEDFAAGGAGHLGEVADLAVESDPFRAFDQAGLGGGAGCEQVADDGDAGVLGAFDAEEGFQVTWVALGEPGIEGLGGSFVGAFDGFEKRD
jgi:hypothetical protein